MTSRSPAVSAIQTADWRDGLPDGRDRYSYAFLDEGAKREIRRKMLKAVAIPGCQIPFGSREMPIARGWGRDVFNLHNLRAAKLMNLYGFHRYLLRY